MRALVVQHFSVDASTLESRLFDLSNPTQVIPHKSSLLLKNGLAIIASMAFTVSFTVRDGRDALCSPRLDLLNNGQFDTVCSRHFFLGDAVDLALSFDGISCGSLPA